MAQTHRSPGVSTQKEAILSMADLFAERYSQEAEDWGTEQNSEFTDLFNHDVETWKGELQYKKAVKFNGIRNGYQGYEEGGLIPVGGKPDKGSYTIGVKSIISVLEWTQFFAETSSLGNNNLAQNMAELMVDWEEGERRFENFVCCQRGDGYITQIEDISGQSILVECPWFLERSMLIDIVDPDTGLVVVEGAKILGSPGNSGYTFKIEDTAYSNLTTAGVLDGFEIYAHGCYTPAGSLLPVGFLGHMMLANPPGHATYQGYNRLTAEEDFKPIVYYGSTPGTPEVLTETRIQRLSLINQASGSKTIGLAKEAWTTPFVWNKIVQNANATSDKTAPVQYVHSQGYDGNGTEFTLNLIGGMGSLKVKAHAAMPKNTMFIYSPKTFRRINGPSFFLGGDGKKNIVFDISTASWKHMRVKIFGLYVNAPRANRIVFDMLEDTRPPVSIGE